MLQVILRAAVKCRAQPRCLPPRWPCTPCACPTTISTCCDQAPCSSARSASPRIAVLVLRPLCIYTAAKSARVSKQIHVFGSECGRSWQFDFHPNASLGMRAADTQRHPRVGRTARCGQQGCCANARSRARRRQGWRARAPARCARHRAAVRACWRQWRRWRRQRRPQRWSWRCAHTHARVQTYACPALACPVLVLARADSLNFVARRTASRAVAHWCLLLPSGLILFRLRVDGRHWRPGGRTEGPPQYPRREAPQQPPPPP